LGSQPSLIRIEIVRIQTTECFEQIVDG